MYNLWLCIYNKYCLLCLKGRFFCKNLKILVQGADNQHSVVIM